MLLNNARNELAKMTSPKSLWNCILYSLELFNCWNSRHGSRVPFCSFICVFVFCFRHRWFKYLVLSFLSIFACFFYFVVHINSIAVAILFVACVEMLIGFACSISWVNIQSKLFVRFRARAAKFYTKNYHLLIFQIVDAETPVPAKHCTFRNNVDYVACRIYAWIACNNQDSDKRLMQINEFISFYIVLGTRIDNHRDNDKRNN